MSILSKIKDFIGSAEVASVASGAGLAVDGIGGKATVKALQRYFGTTVDGVISGQKSSLIKKYCPSLTAVKCDKVKSTCVKKLQTWCGASADGIWGKSTSTALQTKLCSLGYDTGKVDGIFGTNSMKALQRFLNANAPAPAPTPTPTTIGDKVIEACKVQADWMHSAKYGDYSPVTINHSKKAGTCVTYEGCVLQRLGVKKSGGYVWHDGRGYGTGKVTGANKKMSVMYQNNKELSSLKSVLQKGDMILLDDNKSGVKGKGGHVMFFSGKWKDNDPYVWDMELNRTCVKNGKARKYSGSRKCLAIVRVIKIKG